MGISVCGGGERIAPGVITLRVGDLLNAGRGDLAGFIALVQNGECVAYTSERKRRYLVTYADREDPEMARAVLMA